VPWFFFFFPAGVGPFVFFFFSNLGVARKKIPFFINKTKQKTNKKRGWLCGCVRGGLKNKREKIAPPQKTMDQTTRPPGKKKNTPAGPGTKKKKKENPKKKKKPQK